MMDIRLAIIIISQVQSAFATINYIFNNDGQKEAKLIEVDGCYVPSVSEDYMLFCEERDLCEYLARKAVERFSDEYDPDFCVNFVFCNIDQKLFEEAEKTIIQALHLSDEEIDAAPVLLKRYL